MKTRLSIAIGLLIIAGFCIPGVIAVTPTGNGAMSGPHYTLNLIGVKKTDQHPTDANNGHRIFVNLQGNSKIYLTEGSTFNVIDADATDGRGEFQLPAPDNMYNVSTGEYLAPGNYMVFARAVGKPGGSGMLSTCTEYFNETSQLTETLCSMDNVTLSRTKSGAPKFTDVTRQLTTVNIDTNGDGTLERSDIFSNELLSYLWSYDNNGLKNVQLRFYQVAG